MDSQGKGLIKALENWAKKVTKGYKDVEVHNMDSSFRDGLAFCAIIHKYRPDLIDFDSLSKENILENNHLAFSVAQKQLGVPALLDAEDMVKYTRPDRLSIITYLSQLHNCFENQNKVKTAYKRVQSNNVMGPPSKVIVTEPPLLTSRRVEVCQMCSHRVFILERLIVDGKLYHTACFKCCKCNCLLNPGAYVESDIPGEYECSVCLPDDKANNVDADNVSQESSEEENDSSLSSIPESPQPVQNNVKSPLFDSVTRARTNFLEDSLAKPNSITPLPKLEGITATRDKLYSPIEKRELPTNGVSVKAKISVFESSSTLKSPEPRSLELTSPLKSKESPGITTSYITNSLTKSPKPSVRLSLISPSVKTENISPKDLEEKTVLSTTATDNVDGIPSIHKTPLEINISEASTATLDCDNLKSTHEMPISDVNALSIQNNSTNLTSSLINSDKGNNTFRKPLEGYKSSLKPSRDIFKTNIQPLKLTIPTINTSASKETISLPVTPLSNYSKSPTEVSQIKITQPRSLPRPLSYCSLSSKDKSNEAIENDSTNALHNKFNDIIARRRSLDSDRNEIAEDKSLTCNSEKTEISSLNNVSLSTEVDSKGILPKTESQNRIKSTTLTTSVDQITPIPSIRRNIEIKNLELQRETSESAKKSELHSITSILSSSSTAKTPQKSIREISPIISLTPKDKSLQSVLVKPSTIEAPPEEQAEESYPDDLNPFEDDEIEKEEEYPDDLNPFGDDEEPPAAPKVFEGVSADNYDESKNPFASDEEESESISYSTPSPRPPLSQNNSPFNTLSSPTGSLRGTTKKRKAPKPPKLSDIFPNESSGDSSKIIKSSPAVSRKGLETPSPKLRKNKPAPPPPPTPSPRQTSQATVAENAKFSKDLENQKLKSTTTKQPTSEPKKKKRPAPSVPIPMRKDRKKIPLKDILREMKEIETKQREFEKQGREIELLIRDRDKDEEPSVEEEEYIMQLFELVNQKNALFRRQAELMHIKRSQRLEEQQEKLETQIRQLMAKPAEEKTDEDKSKEEELIYELTDIVDQRNSIIDSIEMERRRELEEDVSVQEQIEIKNGDLPIAAEIKEKNKGKTKKDKKKKDKKKEDKKKDKKLHENGDSGKSTLKRRLFK